MRLEPPIAVTHLLAACPHRTLRHSVVVVAVHGCGVMCGDGGVSFDMWWSVVWSSWWLFVVVCK